MKLPRILITAMRSGAGKTMLTCGILKAMKMQEINPASFKCGPDYIDPMFHKTVIGISSYNLDSFLCGENGVREILKKNGAGADISVMEGVMGYYDGIAGISSEASAYDIARITDTPAVMILDCKGLSVSAVPCIQGFLHYKEDSRIKGVILNRLSPMMYGRMKEMIEVQTGIKVYGYVPVISLNLAGLEKHPGFKLTVPMLHRLFYGIIYGDMLLSLVNQCKPYEKNKGQTERLADELTALLANKMQTEGISFKKVKQNCKMILSRFAEIPREKEGKVKVGVVGEIYVKYSPLGNNNLEQFLTDEGAEVVVPGLLDFFMYCIVSNISDIELYGLHKIRKPALDFVFKYLQKQQNEIIGLMKADGNFTPPTPISHTMELLSLIHI